VAEPKTNFVYVTIKYNVCTTFISSSRSQ